MAVQDDRRDTGTGRVLSSIWTGLSPHLLARFYPVKRDSNDKAAWGRSTGTRKIDGDPSFSVDDGFEVQAPITDANREYTFGWHSPFENAGSGSLFPTLSSLLQSGTVAQMAQSITGNQQSDEDSAMAKLAATLQSAEGRTGITKLNSTQVFLAMQPVKIPMTLHFRALVDPKREVQDPIVQLLEWSLPQYLAKDGVIANAIKNSDKGIDIQTVLPSLAPQLIAFQYADTTMLPMVVENVSEPLTTPRNIQGYQISTSVQITLSSLSALDRSDVNRIFPARSR